MAFYIAVVFFSFSLLLIGNALSNTIWEALVPSNSVKKPDRNSSYSERDKFIRAKYEKRLFLDPPYHENLTDEELTAWVNVLIQGSANGTPTDMLNALAHGVDLTVDVKNKYPLHLACQKGSLICVYLLVMNGIDIFERNESGSLSSEIAESYGHMEIASLLKKRQDMIKSFSTTKSQNEIVNPVALAIETEVDGVSLEIVSDLRLESSPDTTTNFTSPDPENPFYDEDLKMI